MGELKFNEEEKFRGTPSYHKNKKESKLKKFLYKIGFGKKVSPSIIIILVILLSASIVFAIYNISKGVVDSEEEHKSELNNYLEEPIR
jgi:hypothetical protein